VSAAVTILAFACYYASLLPGLDFGDTAAYQSVVGEWRTSPRQAYPLYFAIANIAFALVGGEPARALNLVSAAAGALACGATVWLGTSLTRSLLAGLVSGLFLARSIRCTC
jgi:4-amino-4-deoxy-L-arabinose transferase-like glycosyltransferase